MSDFVYDGRRWDDLQSIIDLTPDMQSAANCLVREHARGVGLDGDSCSAFLRRCMFSEGGGLHMGFGGSANHHFVACPAQTSPSAQAGYSGTHDHDFHFYCL